MDEVRLPLVLTSHVSSAYELETLREGHGTGIIVRACFDARGL